MSDLVPSRPLSISKNVNSNRELVSVVGNRSDNRLLSNPLPKASNDSSMICYDGYQKYKPSDYTASALFWILNAVKQLVKFDLFLYRMLAKSIILVLKKSWKIVRKPAVIKTVLPLFCCYIAAVSQYSLN